MSRDVQVAAPETTLEQACALMAQHHLKTLPVREGDQVVGVVELCDLDLLSALMARGRLGWRGMFGRRPLRVAQVMSQRLVSVGSDHPLEGLLPLLSEHGVHCLLVLDEHRLAGVITQTDLIAGLRRHLLSHCTS